MTAFAFPSRSRPPHRDANDWYHHRMTKPFFASAVAIAILVACGGGSPQPSPAPASPKAAPGCGIDVFPNPACEAALDQSCCGPQLACAGDAGCRDLVACFHGCLNNMTCLKQCRDEHLPGYMVFGGIANCRVTYPKVDTCGIDF